MTPKGKGLTITSYQMKCHCPDHNEAAACTKTFTTSGGGELCRRKLKLWALSADNDAPTKAAHMEMWPAIMLLEAEVVPSEETLDAMEAAKGVAG